MENKYRERINLLKHITLLVVYFLSMFFLLIDSLFISTSLTYLYRFGDSLNLLLPRYLYILLISLLINFFCAFRLGANLSETLFNLRQIATYALSLAGAGWLLRFVDYRRLEGGDITIITFYVSIIFIHSYLYYKEESRDRKLGVIKKNRQNK